MQSYSSKVTKYLMAASEGVIQISSEKQFVIEKVEGSLDGNTAWGFFDRVYRQDRIQWFNFADIQGAWPGNDYSRLTMDKFMADRINDVYFLRRFNKQTIISAFESCHKRILHMYKTLSKEDGSSHIALWWKRPDYPEDIRKEGDILRDQLEPSCKGYWEAEGLARSIVVCRMLYSVVKECTTVGLREAVDDLPVKEAVKKYAPIVEDPKLFAAEFKSGSPEKRMFLSDYRENKDSHDVAARIVCNARNRILLHLKGAGGFIVSCAGRKFEISSRGDGSTGLYYREFVLAEAYTKEQSTETGTTVSTGFEIGFEMFSFSASVELHKSQSYGWAVSTEENPTEWKTIKEKTFLDGMSSGHSSLARFVLYMNWYVGGLSEWHHTSRHVEYGHLMKEDALPLETLRYLPSFKVDSHFRVGDMLSASKSEFEDKETWFHKNAGKDAKGYIAFERVNPGENVMLSGFTPADCEFVLAKTPSELEQIVV